MDMNGKIFDLSDKLIKSKNIILRGAPGTGKTFLAKKVAAQIIETSDEKLSDNQQFEFVQFHPSFDYTDFVEGLRTKFDENNQVSFELVPGTFMSFCNRAKAALKEHRKFQEKEQRLKKQEANKQAWFFFNEKVKNNTPSAVLEDFKQPWSELIELLEKSKEKSLSINWSEDSQEKMDIKLLGNGNIEFEETYYNGVDLNYIKKQNRILTVVDPSKSSERVAFWKNFQKLFKYLIFHNNLYMDDEIIAEIEQKDFTDTAPKYIFVIDEINRGELSKIFGELFFSVDPSYRGPKGSVATQYASLHGKRESFYVPENVYIIGTMNDIDRSVESFDFAMRRRFRFVEVKACDQMEMLNAIEQSKTAISILEKLNQEIENISGLNSNYHIGPSYFLRLKEVDDDFELLWTDYIGPLIQEYIRGFYDENELMERLKTIYYDVLNEKEQRYENR
ncbi:AAA family ATPase [uncultured Enterococcus sp.]|uniref:AAA family ATPase n=1 Tax=uncultured Enterococcus sp. TaxID=167972 RepID=UPI002AA725A1|nr:AAA family ATPase [uncultured Enterococcus sp.]